MDPNQHGQNADAPEQERIGHTLENRYRILEVLAQGGMGVVYRGERIGLNRPVAIKFLHANFAGNTQARERFERELQAMSRLTHPNCISVIDYGIADSPFIVMEYVTGRTLKDVLTEEGRLAPLRALFIVSQILGALAHAHSQEMVHRDIKPANVVLASVEGVMDHVYVLDFGLAKFMSSAAKDKNELTASWMVLGTPAYMAPEQARGETVGAATDIYATGVLLFELLTGSKPFYSDNPIETIQLHQSAPVPSIRERLPAGGFSLELDVVVQTALAKDPGRRFASATAFAEALDDVPEATTTRASTRLRAMTPPARLRADSVHAGSDVAALVDQGGIATAILDSGAGAQQPPGAQASVADTVPLSNSDIQVVSSAPILLPRTERPPTRAPAAEAVRAPGKVGAPIAGATAPTSAGNGIARLLLACVFLAVAGVVTWYATSEEAVQPAEIAQPAPEPPGSDTALVPSGPVAQKDPAANDPSAAASAPPVQEQTPPPPDARPALIQEQVAVAPPDAAVATAPAQGEQAGTSDTATPTPGSAETSRAQPPRPRAHAAGAIDDIDDIDRLIQQGRRDEAIRGILQLRRTNFTRSGYLAFMLGNLYFEKQQWSNGLTAYNDALRLKPEYRSNATLNENVIRAFSHKQTWPKAKTLFLGPIRSAGLKYLRTAAQSDKNAVVRDRAKQIITALNGRK
jgi:serine/threonine protein kinase